MRRFSTLVTGNRQRNSASNPLTWTLIFAFLLQSCITQIHIHGTLPVAGSAIIKVLAQVPNGGKSSGDNAANCPFCQAIVHAGVFFTPGPPLLVRPAMSAESVVPILPMGLAAAVLSHSWQSRAPPRR